MNKVLKVDIVSLWNLLLFCNNFISLLNRGTFDCVLIVQLPVLESLLLQIGNSRKILIVRVIGCPGVSAIELTILSFIALAIIGLLQ